MSDQKKKQSHVVLIAAGGTGGHIYPALSIAVALKAQDPQLDIQFVGSPHGLEGKLIPHEGFQLLPLTIGRLNQNISRQERLFTALKLPFVGLQALQMVRKLNPRFVLGVGGAITGPILLASIILRKKTFIWEPNAHAGLANRWLAPMVTESLVVFKEALTHMKTKRYFMVGIPVRQSIEKQQSTQASSSVSLNPLKIFIFGGSQGSQAINSVVAQAILEGGEWLKNVAFVHQTGSADHSRIVQMYQSLKNRSTDVSIEVVDYIHNMEQRYSWADVIIARSGVGTVAELAACGKPAILIPLPSAADHHQQRNAEALVAQEAAIMILQSEFTAEKLKQIISELKTHPEKLAHLQHNIRQFHQPHAAAHMAQHLLKVTSSS